MMSSPEAMCWEFWWLLKKAVSWDLSLDEASWFLNLGEASPVCGRRDERTFVGSVSWDSDFGPRIQLGSWLKNDVETVSIVKIVSLSPRVGKLKVKKKKVNKRFVPEQRKSLVFRVFRDFYEHFTYPYISHIRIMAIQQS